MDTSSISGENCDPIYRNSPLTLQNLASMRIAFCLWVEKFRKIRQDSDESYFDIRELRREILTYVKFPTNLPFKYIKMIDLCADHINKEMKDWGELWSEKLNPFDIKKCSRFDSVVIGGNGFVHFHATIANILEDNFFNDRPKFEIACVSCVEEKVDFFWPLVREKCDLKSILFNREPLLYYWICRKRGELNRIPLEDYDRIEHLMIAKCLDQDDYCCNFFAIEYFLNTLDPLDRLDQINQMLRFSRGLKCVAYLLPRFEASVQRLVLDKRPISIFREFFSESANIEYTFQTWLQVRDRFTPELFNKHVIQNYGHDYTSRAKLLPRIWSNAPNHFKNDLSTVLNNLYGYHFSNGHYDGFLDRDVGILLAVMSDADEQLRNDYWEKNWPKWIEIVPPSQFNQLLETCIVNSEAILKFKKLLTDQIKSEAHYLLDAWNNIFRKYCSNLMEKGYYIELDEILNNLTLEQEQVLELKKRILATKGVCFWESLPQMEIHSKYIDSVFSYDQTLSQDFKQSWILSNYVWHSVSSSQLGFNFKMVKSIISLFVSSNRQTECKSKILEKFREEITRGELEYKLNVLQPFLLWCMEDDAQRVDDFVASLPMDVIFEAAFSRGMKPSHPHDPLPRFDRRGSVSNRFFKKLFKSKTMFENFKRDRVEYYERMDETEVRNKFGQDKKVVIELMRNGFLMNDEDIID